MIRALIIIASKFTFHFISLAAKLFPCRAAYIFEILFNFVKKHKVVIFSESTIKDLNSTLNILKLRSRAYYIATLFDDQVKGYKKIWLRYLCAVYIIMLLILGSLPLGYDLLDYFLGSLVHGVLTFFVILYISSYQYCIVSFYRSEDCSKRVSEWALKWEDDRKLAEACLNQSKSQINLNEKNTNNIDEKVSLLWKTVASDACKHFVFVSIFKYIPYLILCIVVFDFHCLLQIFGFSIFKFLR